MAFLSFIDDDPCQTRKRRERRERERERNCSWTKHVRKPFCGPNYFLSSLLTLQSSSSLFPQTNPFLGWEEEQKEERRMVAIHKDWEASRGLERVNKTVRSQNCFSPWSGQIQLGFCGCRHKWRGRERSKKRGKEQVRPIKRKPREGKEREKEGKKEGEKEREKEGNLVQTSQWLALQKIPESRRQTVVERSQVFGTRERRKQDRGSLERREWVSEVIEWLLCDWWRPLIGLRCSPIRGRCQSHSNRSWPDSPIPFFSTLGRR